MKILDMGSDKITWLYNRVGEKFNDKLDVPQEVDSWYRSLYIEERGYLVKYGDTYGYMFLVEFSHTESDLFDEDGWAESRGRTETLMWDVVSQTANRLIGKTSSPNTLIFTGRKTGWAERHELGVFFPFGTDKPSVDTDEGTTDTIVEAVTEEYLTGYSGVISDTLC